MKWYKRLSHNLNKIFYWLTDRPTHQPTDQPTGRLTDRPIEQQTDWLTN